MSKIFILLFLLPVMPAIAEMSYREMKGVHELINPKYEFLSPIYGLTLLGTNTLENLRFYGNYKDKKKGLGCLESSSNINRILVSNKDCPQDHISELIQRLFPSQDGVSLVANQIDSDLASHLDPTTLGRLVGALARVQDTDLAVEEKRKSLEVELTDLLIEGISAHEKKKIRARQLKALSKTLVKALEESRFAQVYPHHLPERLLLAYFWKKANHKEDLLSLVLGMASTPLRSPDFSVLRDPEFLHDMRLQKQFLSEKYSEFDFSETLFSKDPNELSKILFSDPEKLTFYGYEENLGKRPAILTYGSAHHSSLAGLDKSSYPDCGETSLRNFFNIVLYNPKTGKFDPTLLDLLKAKDTLIELNAGLREYYRTYFDPATSMSQKARDDWSQSVVSQHIGVKYRRPKTEFEPVCEIDSGIDNILNLLDRLLYGSFPISGAAGSISRAASRTEKLNVTCKLFSRDDFKLSWEVKGDKDHEMINSKDTGISVTFMINGHPSFNWQFMSGHFAIVDIQQYAHETWKNKIARVVSGQMAENSGANRDLLFHWVTTESNWEQLMESKVEAASVPTHLIYALPLASTEVKLSIFSRILAHRKQYLYPFAQKIQAKIPQYEVWAQSLIEARLADADYPEPWSDPIQAIGNPKIQYHRVDQGVASPEKSFARSWKGPAGLIWKDVLEDQLGSGQGDKKLKWKNAKNHCLDLNPATQRQKLSSALESLDLNEVLIHLRNKYWRERTDENRERLLTQYGKIRKELPLGCYLPTIEDFLQLAQDLGYKDVDSKYIPQFLPHLYNAENSTSPRWFWSSSSSPNNPFSALSFSGMSGELDEDFRYFGLSVRCVCLN